LPHDPRVSGETETPEKTMETTTKSITLDQLGDNADSHDLAAFAAELRVTAPHDGVLIALRSDLVVIAFGADESDAVDQWTTRVWETGSWVADAIEARQIVADCEANA
jgi:hypothetical protein